MAIKNYVVVGTKQIRPGVKVEAIRSEDKLDWGVSVELDLKKADEDEDMDMENIVESFKGFTHKVAQSTINTNILKTISNAQWERVAAALKAVAKKYNFFSVDFDFYGVNHEFKIFANDKLIFASKMPEYITEDNCKAISVMLDGGVDAVLAFFKEFLPS